MLSQRRRHSRWRMSLIFVIFLGLICNSESVPVNGNESSSSAPTAKRKSEDISLNDFTWQAWLMVDPQNFQHGMDSATFLRRITPKSVFIAPPALPACAEGYHADEMGRCVKSVNIDAIAHTHFILERLNAKFANAQASTNKNDQKKSTGPLQLNIPLIPSDPKSPSTKIELEETFSMHDPVAVPFRNETHPDDEEKTRPHEIAIASKYEMKNYTILDGEETTFLAGNSSDNVSEIHPKVDTVVPVTDLVEETKQNGTSFSEEDYKIPIDLKISLNSSKRLNTSDITKNAPTTETPENFTEISPTLILLIPSTKLPSIANNLPITHNETSHAIVQISNVTSNETAKEVIAVSVPDSVLTSADKLIEVPSIATDEQRDNKTYTDDETTSESSKLNESQETEFYDEEEEDVEYSYSTDIPDEEDLVELENEEILRHGEAGMTIPTRNLLLHHDQQQQNQTTDQKKPLTMHDRIMIHFNDSTLMPTEDKDEAGSNVSSEVSIDGDLILETTLLDVNTEKLQTTSKSPNVIRAIKSSDDEESSGKNPRRSDIIPEEVLSHEADDTTISLHGRERTEHLTELEDKKNDKAVVPSVESLLYNFPEEDSIKEIHTTDKEQSTVKDSTLQENSKDLTVPADDFKQTTMNFGSVENFVRFPNYVKQSQQDGSYVRFPSSEANIIHSLRYKQPIDDADPHDGTGTSTSTKRSVPVRQKPVYYLPSWKPEQLQTDHVPTSERQRPDLLRFWNKMPLVREPNVYRGYQVPGGKEADDTQELPRVQFHRTSRLRTASFFTPEASSENVNRVFAPRSRLPIDD